MRPLRGVDVSRFRIRGIDLHETVPAAYGIYTDEPGEVPFLEVWVRLLVSDLETGADNEVCIVRRVRGSSFKGEKRTLWIRRTVLDALAHELDECLFIDGKQASDPHPDKPEWHARWSGEGSPPEGFSNRIAKTE